MEDSQNRRKVSAIVVSFNRKEFLWELYNALLKQTYPLKSIIIIDNSHNLETASYLKEKGILENIPSGNIPNDWVYEREGEEKDINLTYVKTSKNIGGAGGFSLGLKLAYEKVYELFWLMDDDVEPLTDALEYQIKFLDISQCITPSKKAIDGEYLEWWGWLNLKNLREEPIPEHNIKGEYAEVNMTCFEGALISRDIVSKIGFPNPEFFIYGDDVVYGYKASQHTKCIYLLKPTFVKKLKKKNFHKRFGRYYPFASLSLSHYLMRNYLLKAYEIKKTAPDKVNIGFVYLYHFYYYIKQMVKAIFIEWNLKKLSVLTKGFLESFKIIREK